jgi:hypothetical protein
MNADSAREELRRGTFPPAEQATPKGRNQEKQRQRQPVAGTFYQCAAKRGKEHKHQNQRRDRGGNEPVQQAFQFGNGQNSEQEEEHRSILANVHPMAKCRNKEQEDRGKKSPGEGSDMKHAGPVHGKSRANGEQQESSTDAEKTTRDQPGCKTSHHIPP